MRVKVYIIIVLSISEFCRSNDSIAKDQYDSILISSKSSIVWSRYFGKDGDESAYDLDLDNQGNIYITGYTDSENGFATQGAYQEKFGGKYDAFLLKINGKGQILWTTYLGGPELDVANDLIVKDNCIYIVGNTSSKSGIAFGNVSTKYAGGEYDAFIAKFDLNGSLIWATYYGGNGNDQAYGISLNSNEEIIVSGITSSDNGIVTKDAFEISIHEGFDAFFAKFNRNGQLIYGTYFGGNNEDLCYNTTIDDNDNIYLSGSTNSSDLPITINKNGKSYSGGKRDGFIARFDNQLNLNYCSYYGGEGEDIINDLLLTKDKFIILGTTDSRSGISYGNSFKTMITGDSIDSFVSMYDFDGNAIWGSYYGGNGKDVLESAEIVNDSVLFMLGTTDSQENISSDNTELNPNPNQYDAFLCNFDISGNRLSSTYFGGSNNDNPYSIAFDENNSTLIITGNTLSKDYISINSPEQSLKDQYRDLFIAKFRTIDPKININIEKRTFCSGSTFGVGIFTNTEFGYGNVFTIQLSDETGSFDNPINIGNVNVGSSVNQSVTLPADLKYGDSYSLRIISSNPTLLSDTITNIIIVPFIKTELINPELNICEGSIVSYSFNKQYDEIYSLVTVTGGIILSDSTQSPCKVLWTEPGNHAITLIYSMSDTMCYDTVLENVNVYPKPIAEFSGDTVVCLNSEIQYALNRDDSSDYRWEVENGIITDSTDSYITILWNQLSSCKLSLTVIGNNNCCDTSAKQIRINELPNVTLDDFEDYVLSTPPFELSGGLPIGGPYSGPGVNNNLFYPTEAGIGKHVITYTYIDSNGCSSNAKANIIVYPENPFVQYSIDNPFPNVICESFDTVYISITNIGAKSLNIQNIDLVGENAGDFKILDILDSIRGRDSVILKVLFNPLDTGNREAGIIIENDSDNNPLLGIGIGGRKDSTGLVFSDSSILFSNVPPYIKVEKEIALEYLGTLSYTTSFPIIIDENFTLESIEPLVFDSDHRKGIAKFTFNNGIEGHNYSATFALIDSLCGHDGVINLHANVNPKGKVRILLDTLSAFPGDTVIMIVRLTDTLLFQESRVSGISFLLHLKSTLLEYIGEYDYELNDDERHIHVIHNFNNGFQTQLKFIARLSSDSTTFITLDSIETIGGLLDVDVVKGIFKLSGICYEGGPRLIDTKGQVTIYSIKPEPAIDECIVTYETIEKGLTQLIIYNSLGMELKSIVKDVITPGRESLTLNLDELFSGTYFFALITPSDYRIKPFRIIR